MGIFGSKKQVRFNRIFLMILDSAGIGGFNDNINTLKHITENSQHEYKNLAKLGLFNLIKNDNFPAMAYHATAVPAGEGVESVLGFLELIGMKKEISLLIKDRTILDNLIAKKYNVSLLGNIKDIYSEKRCTAYAEMPDNTFGIRLLMRVLHNEFTGLCAINFNDFDTKYAQKGDIQGYADALREIDEAIPHILSYMNDKDLLIITSNYGFDPAYAGKESRKEKVPVFIYSSVFRHPKKMPEFNTLGDIGAIIADNFDVAKPNVGKSVLNNLS